MNTYNTTICLSIKTIPFTKENIKERFSRDRLQNAGRTWRREQWRLQPSTGGGWLSVWVDPKAWRTGPAMLYRPRCACVDEPVQGQSGTHDTLILYVCLRLYQKINQFIDIIPASSSMYPQPSHLQQSLMHILSPYLAIIQKETMSRQQTLCHLSNTFFPHQQLCPHTHPPHL